MSTFKIYQMYKVIILLILALPLQSQSDITGSWHGLLKIQSLQLRLVFNIKNVDGSLKATMDSPDQGAKDIPVDQISYEGNQLKLSVKSAGITYEGLFDSDQNIKGTFKQGPYTFPLDLTKDIPEKEIVTKPQDPVKPYPYMSEDIFFENKKAGITLAGTLTLPFEDGQYPVVILISGSGPQNRDSELLGHKPFLVLSDYLTRNRIAVMRYDDRGTASSKGNFQSATSADFASDVEAGIEYLKTRKEINKASIGLIGHSEGGLIAPLVASNSKDVAFIVLLAGPSIPGDQILLLQQELIGRATGVSEQDIAKSKKDNEACFSMIKKANDQSKVKAELIQYITQMLENDPNPKIPAGMTKETFMETQVSQLTSPWMQFFLTYDPQPALSKVKCPVLALNGEKDLQVPPKENLSAIKAALKKAKNKNVTIKELPGLNHLFQESNTGAPSEYAEIEQTFSPIALVEILNWVNRIVK
jgi:fermentation-respiration switch protein FrsA (DUF1100 family)